MKKIFIFTIALMIINNAIAQNKTYNSFNEGIYYPNLNEEWVIVKQDTIKGSWVKDTFFANDNIHSYIFRDSGVETRWNLCEPPTDVIFLTQFGLPYTAQYWSFRKTTEGIYLLGYPDVDQEATIIVLLQSARYNPETGKVVAYQNGRRATILNQISQIADE